MQIMKGALADYNKSHRESLVFDQMFVPGPNIRVGCWYLRHLIARWDGDVTKGLQSYNQGFTRVKRQPVFGLWYAEGVRKHKAKFDELISAGRSNEPSV
jgi:soluble lytic murein transglycosylase-like protein